MLRSNGKVIAVAAVAGAMLTTTTAFGFGDGNPAKGGARNPSADARKSYTKETEIIANLATYGTRQSNKSANGGGAIYGCRSGAGGTPKGMRPCVRANNLNQGLAFEFFTGGVLGGTIDTQKPGDASRPFTTNATGVATGLNADRVDSKSADDIAKDAVVADQVLRPLAQVGATGAAGTLRGVQDNGVSRQGTGDYNVVFTGDLSKCALTATLIGTTPGQVTVNPSVAADKKTTTVDVRTFNPAGTTPDDHAFHLSASC